VPRCPCRKRIAGLALLSLAAGLALAPVASPAAADPQPVQLLVRVLGPADEDTFRTTGEYQTLWSGDIEVPTAVNVTAASGKEYRLFVEDGRYIAERVSDGQTWDRSAADDDRGATSVLAAVHRASIEGGFDYELSDSWFPGSGFYLTGILGHRAHGTVGWSYRVYNGDVAPAPQPSVDMFLLGYDSSLPGPPHEELIIYWGYGIDCRPLRIVAPEEPVQCGEPVPFTVEVFVDEGFSGDGDWEPMAGASLCVDGLCVETGADGTAELAFDAPGTYAVSANAPYDGDYYYIPSEGITSVEVEGPCRVISFTVQDHGDPGLNFGLVLRGTDGNAELAQDAGHGAVTLHVGAETTIDCELQLRGQGDLSRPSGSASLALSGLAWSTTPSFAGATPASADYVAVGTSSAGVEASVNVWHWLSVPADQVPDAYSGQFCYRIVGAGS
jgi:hypothetical protein